MAARSAPGSLFETLLFRLRLGNVLIQLALGILNEARWVIPGGHKDELEYLI